MKKLQDAYKVISNEKLCAKFYRLSIDAKPIAEKALPGQFIHIRVNDSLQPFFRRPFSIYRAKKNIEVLYEALGAGTQALAAKKKGDSLDILGPLGTPFSMPPNGTKKIVMIAGGVGVAPFLFLSDVIRQGRIYASPTLEIILLYGGRTRGHIFNMEAFKKNGCKIYKATDDGSVGVKGRVSKLFPNIKPDSGTMIYTCGPRPMMASVQEFTRKHKIKAQGSCEEVMACGLGACLGCSTKTTKGYKTVCGDGPVFDLDELVF